MERQSPQNCRRRPAAQAGAGLRRRSDRRNSRRIDVSVTKNFDLRVFSTSSRRGLDARFKFWATETSIRRELRWSNRRRRPRSPQADSLKLKSLCREHRYGHYFERGYYCLCSNAPFNCSHSSAELCGKVVKILGTRLGLRLARSARPSFGLHR